MKTTPEPSQPIRHSHGLVATGVLAASIAAAVIATAPRARLSTPTRTPSASAPSAAQPSAAPSTRSGFPRSTARRRTSSAASLGWPSRSTSRMPRVLRSSLSTTGPASASMPTPCGASGHSPGVRRATAAATSCSGPTCAREHAGAGATSPPPVQGRRPNDQLNLLDRRRRASWVQANGPCAGNPMSHAGAKNATHSARLLVRRAQDNVPPTQDPGSASAGHVHPPAQESNGAYLAPPRTCTTWAAHPRDRRFRLFRSRERAHHGRSLRSGTGAHRSRQCDLFCIAAARRAGLVSSETEDSRTT